MTFLEFVANRLLGKPSGSSYRCPRCEHDTPSITVRPARDNPKTGKPDPIKFRCHRCAWWGDEYDLAKEFYPTDEYSRRLVRVDQWRAEYEAQVRDEQEARKEREASIEPSEPSNFLPRGSGQVGRTHANRTYAEQTWAALSIEERDVLAAAYRIMEKQPVDFEALATYCVEFDKWIEEGNRKQAKRFDKQTPNGKKRK